MTPFKLSILASASLIAGVAAAPADAQTVPTGNPGTPVAPGERTDPGVPADQANDIASIDAQAQGPDIVVTGVRASMEKALQVKRNATQVVESIVAEDIGKLPDNNVVSALQRISGIQVTDRSGGEANTVSIRGLSDVLTTMNGRVIFTADSRQFALADIPSTLISRVDVYKTRAADQIETGLAGQIDVFTHRPFDFKGFTMSAYVRGIYNEEAGSVSPYVSGLISDRWTTGIGDIGISVNGSYSRNLYRDESITPGALVPFVSPDNPPPGYTPLQRIFPPAFQAGLQNGLPSDAGSTLLLNGVDTPYYLSRDAIFQSDLRGDRKRPAMNAAIQWAPNANSQYTFEFFYDGYRNTTYNNLLFSYVDWWGNLGSDPASTITTYPGTNIIKTRTEGDPVGFMSGDYTYAKTDSYVYALNGKWNVGSRLKLAADLSYQNSEYNSSFAAMRLNRTAGSITVDFNHNDGLPAFSFGNNDLLSDPATWTVGEFYDNGNRSKGAAYTFQGDAVYTPASDFFKKLSVGVRYDDRQADDWVRTQSAGALNRPLTSLDPSYYFFDSGFGEGRADVPTSWVDANGYTVARNIAAVRQLYGFSPTANPMAHTLHVREITKSAYVQGDFEAQVFGRPLRLEAGVRFTDVATPVTFTDQYSGETTSAREHTNAFLPSATLRYDITDNLRLRFNFGKTLRRPDFSALDPNYSLTGDLTKVGYGSGSSGNPNLKATKATNYDLTAEWYFAPGSGIYTTGFIRNIDGLVVSLANGVTFPSAPLAGDPTTTFIVTQPFNASNGTLKGVEFGAVLFPPHLPGILRGLGLQGSFTFLHSSQNIPIVDAQGNITGQTRTSFFGVSNFSYNVTGAYERGPVGLRLSYVWRKAFLYANEASLFANPIGIWHRPEKSLDFQATLQASRAVAVTFDAVNLTNAMSQSYYYFDGHGGPVTDNQGNALLARTFALGVRYSFK